MPNEIIGLVDKTTGIGIPNADARFATSAQGAKADSALQSGAAISNISGLQTALDSKQPSGNYDAAGTAVSAVSTHAAKTDGAAHTISGISGLQTALDSKQPSGSYATSVQGAKADSALQSGAAISNISGLQTALDSKQPSGNYATSAQGAKADSALQSGAAISNISGLQTALDSKQPSGNYATSAHTHPTLASTHNLEYISNFGVVSRDITADDLGKTILCSNDILTTGNTITINFPDISSDSNWDSHLGRTVKIIGVARDGASFAAGDLTIQANHMFLNSASSTADVKKFTTDNTDNGFPMILEVIATKTTRAGRRWLVANISNTGWNKVAVS